MRYISVFSGIEAASVAWQPLGWEPVCFSEIEPFPSAVLAERFPEVPNLGDITKVDWSTYAGTVDIVVGGSPCQSFSVAGKREGLAGASGLMFEYIRAVRELRPRFFVWENVPGALSSTHGEDFRCLLQALDDLGYGVAWRVLDAQFFGVAQRRRRIFLVGCLGDPERAVKVLFESDGLRWDSPSSREKRQELAGASGSGAECDSWAIRTAQTGSNGWGISQQLGHAPAVCFTQNTRDEVRLLNGDGSLVGALAASPGAKQQNYLCMASGQANAEIGHDLSSTLMARQYKDPPILCLADGNANTSIGDNMCGTLKVGGEPPIVLYVSDGTPMALYDGLMWTVRRLMPIECERLQGFPDGWTDIPWHGKESAPDGPRYKALGNSMCVPVMRWIGERIANASETHV